MTKILHIINHLDKGGVAQNTLQRLNYEREIQESGKI